MSGSKPISVVGMAELCHTDKCDCILAGTIVTCYR